MKLQIGTNLIVNVRYTVVYAVGASLLSEVYSPGTGLRESQRLGTGMLKATSTMSTFASRQFAA